MAIGIDMLSVSPAKILPLRRKIRSLDLSDKEDILVRSGVMPPRDPRHFDVYMKYSADRKYVRREK